MKTNPTNRTVCVKALWVLFIVVCIQPIRAETVAPLLHLICLCKSSEMTQRDTIILKNRGGPHPQSENY